MIGDKEGQKKQELEIFNRFSRIVKEKFTSLADADAGGSKMNQLDALYKQPEFNPEKRLLNEMNSMGLHKGLLSGVACFAFLRFSPGAISRMLQRRAGVGTAQPGTVNPFNRASGYKLDPPPGAQPNLERPGLFFRVVRLSLDTFVSLSIGAYASLYFVNKDKMMDQFADIPLVEGRSLLSEELCLDFTQEFQKLDRQSWDKKHPSLSGGQPNSTGRTDFRKTIQGFVVNCRRRAIYEEGIRNEQGLSADEPVVIPPPGVPMDIPVTLDDLFVEERAGRDYGARNGDDYFDTYFDIDDGEQD